VTIASLAPAGAAPAGARDHASGNFGIQVRQAALRWVRRNVAAFGGDPRNVTVFGESAGGVSVCAQLASPKSASFAADHNCALFASLAAA
jgi:para-nitrobenzyl esterase